MQQTVLVQTLVLRGGKVFLGRWRPGSGAFAGRLTGLLGQAPAGTSPEVAAAAACASLLGPGAKPDHRRLQRRALFHFEERNAAADAAQQLGQAYSEHQLVWHLREPDAEPAWDSFEPVTTENFEPVGWFEAKDLPFEDMPEDDKVWYEKVLFHNRMMRGSFTFDGRTLLDHSLEDVDPTEGLCGLATSAAGEDLPLLLHNPACSKSRGLHQALQDRGQPFHERRYLEDPLTLSELQTLTARLLASTSSLTGQELCREEVPGAGSSAHQELLAEMVAMRPELMQRPVLVKGRQAAFGRPSPEDALWLLGPE